MSPLEPCQIKQVTVFCMHVESDRIAAYISDHYTMARTTLLQALKHLVETQADFVKVALPWAHPLEGPTIHIPDWFSQVAFEQPEISELNELLFNQGNSIASFGATFLLLSLISRALNGDPDQAIADLYDFIDRDCNRCIEVLLLEGIEVQDTTEITEGIFLCPVAAVPSSTLQAYLKFVAESKVQMPLSMTHLLREEKRNPGAALFQIREVRPKFYAKMPELRPLDGIPPIHDIANVLTIVGPTSPLTCKSFSELADGEFLKGFVGFSWGAAREETRVFSNISLSAEALIDFVPVIRRYLALPPEVKVRLQVPLHRLNEAVKHRNVIDRALDLGIALEALLLAHQPSKDQLSLQFRLRGAWLLGESAERRAELFKKFGKLYDYRSFAAHSGAVAPAKVSPEEVAATLSEGLRLCAAAIRTIIDDGKFPDWNLLLLGATQPPGAGQLDGILD